MKKAVLIAILIPFFTQARNITAKIDEQVKAVNDNLISWRRHLHEFPELSNRETKTGAFVADKLKNLGLEVKTGVAKTGVVAVLKGGKPGRVIALRADMDGLPVTERVKLPYASTQTTSYNGSTVGVMHACGHDTHTSILLATATVLSKMKKEVPGTVVFIFQPAEEGSPDGEEGGAALMIKEGVMNNPKIEAVFGLHINSATEIGTIKYKPGSMMAFADVFTIKVKGKQTHGAYPWLGIDPIVVSSQIVLGLQTIVSRESELTKAPVVISVGMFHSGVRMNIIPEEAELTGTIRTPDGNMRKEVFERIKKTATNIAESAGAIAEVNFENKTLVTYNDPVLMKRMLPSFEKAAGKEHVKEMEWVMGAEDFSFYGDKVPALFFYLGGMPKGQDPKTAPPHHTPDFVIDDSRLDVGVKAFCQIVFDYGM